MRILLVFVLIFSQLQILDSQEFTFFEETDGEWAGKTFGKSLLDQGDDCKLKDVDDVLYYDCTFQCFNRADNWDEIFNDRDEWRCELATTNCRETDKFDRFNFFYLCYCVMGGNVYIYIPVSLFIIFLLFTQCQKIVEESLAPAMAYLANDFFKMPPTLAGVTFIAIANGCNDVIVALIASATEGGVSYNVGALFGSGLFVASIVISLTIYKAPQDRYLRVDPTLVERDLIFYLFAASMMLVFGIIGKIYTWSACIYLGIYTIMVIVVVYQDSGKGQDDSLIADQDQEDNQDQDDEYRIDFSKFDLNTSSGRFKLAMYKLIYNQNFANLPSYHKKKIFALRQKTKEIHMKKTKEMKEVGEQETPEENNDDEEEQPSTYEKFYNVIDKPFWLVRRLTIPPCNHEEVFSKFRCYICPIPGLAVIWYLFKIPWISFTYIGIPIGLLISLIYYLCLKDQDFDNEQELPKPKLFPFNAIAGALQALAWNFLISQMLVDLLNAYVVIMKLDQTFMGLTILGIGNSLDDALVTITYACDPRNARMGITAGYNGQLFGLLVGFGVAQLKATLTHGPQDFEIFTMPIKYCLDTVVIIIFIITLAYSIRHIKANDLYLTKDLASFLMMAYVVNCTIAISVQSWFAATDVNIME